MTRDTLLSVLPSELSARLIGQASTVTLAANQTLFAAGDACDGCYHVIEGLLKVVMVLPSRRERILAILGPGGFAGEPLVDGRGATVGLGGRHSGVEALLHHLRGVRRARADKSRALSLHREFAGAATARQQRQFGDELSLGEVGAARALLGLADAFGKDVGAGRILIRHRVSQRDLAAMAGIARENVSRILQDWMRGALVSRLAGYYCIENKPALEREADV